MSDPLPAFERPPVVETVLSVQFNPLPELVPPKIGWFWRENLDCDDWPTVQMATPIVDQFETFDDPSVSGLQRLAFNIATGVQAVRTQIVSRNDDRVIQIQPTRLAYNWRSREDDYPSFDGLFPEFKRVWSLLQGFVNNQLGVESIAVNQWEITYVNHIKEGDLWTNSAEWGRVLPSVSIPPTLPSKTELEAIDITWRYEIVPKRGRLHVSIKPRIEPSTGAKLLSMNLTARGPVDASKEWTLENGVETGHAVVVEAFESLTSKQAHKEWRKKHARGAT